MRTKRTWVAATALLTIPATQAQWGLGGNQVNGTEWFGATAGSTIPLHLRTIPNLSIDFSTSNLLRMRFYPNQNSTIGGFQNVNQHGFLGLSGHANFFNGVGPFTRLHLADNSGNLVLNAQEFGIRCWQRNGTAFTGNNEQSDRAPLRR